MPSTPIQNLADGIKPRFMRHGRAAKALVAQRAKPIGARAIIKITVPHNNWIDADNKIKPTLDLLVRAGVLVDDSCKYVAEVSAAFGDVRECHISVEAEAVKP